MRAGDRCWIVDRDAIPVARLWWTVNGRRIRALSAGDLPPGAWAALADALDAVEGRAANARSVDLSRIAAERDALRDERDALLLGIENELPDVYQRLVLRYRDDSGMGGTPGEALLSPGSDPAIVAAQLRTDAWHNAVDPPGEDEGRLCSRSYARHPENHVEPVEESPGWGRCAACNEVVNISGQRIPAHRVREHSRTADSGELFCRACGARLVADGDSWACPRRIEAEADPASAEGAQ